MKAFNQVVSIIILIFEEEKVLRLANKTDGFLGLHDKQSQLRVFVKGFYHVHSMLD